MTKRLGVSSTLAVVAAIAALGVVPLAGQTAAAKPPARAAASTTTTTAFTFRLNVGGEFAAAFCCTLLLLVGRCVRWGADRPLLGPAPAKLVRRSIRVFIAVNGE